MKLKRLILLIGVLVSISLYCCNGVGAEIYSGVFGAGENSNNLAWSLDTQTGVLEITGSGEMEDFYSKLSPWNNYRYYIKKVIIGDSVTSIGGNAFYKYTSITSVIIGNGVEKIKGAFSGCTSLTDITIGENVKSFSSSEFYNCPAVTNIYWNCINANDLSQGQNIFAYVGQGGDGITLTFGDNVKRIPSYAFGQQKGTAESTLRYPKLKSVIISDSVESVGTNLFYGSNNLTDVRLSNKIIAIPDKIFYSCTALKNVPISVSVESIGTSVFKGCTAFENIILHDGENSIESGTFEKCTALTNIGNNAFEKCTALTNIIIPDGVTVGDEAFKSCSGIKSLTINEKVVGIGNQAFLNVPD